MQFSLGPACAKLGMPVILMPCLITQNSCAGESSATTSFRSGGSGCSPSENLAQLTPGAPWQLAQPCVANALAPACTLAGSLMEGGGWSCAWLSIDAVRTWVSAQVTTAGSSAVP